MRLHVLLLLVAASASGHLRLPVNSLSVAAARAVAAVDNADVGAVESWPVDSPSVSISAAANEAAPPVADESKQAPAASPVPSYTPFDMARSKGVASATGGALGAVAAGVLAIGAAAGLG